MQNAIANINSTLTNEISNIQTEIDNLEVTSSQNVSKELHYHTNHTDFMYQRNNTNHNYDNRRTFVLQQHYFTYQRKGASVELELQVQNLQTQIDNLQTQIYNYHSGGSDIGTV